jgi:hypothetical protein
VYFALFTKVDDDLFRLDTRIYLNDSGGPGLNDACVAAVVAKNPGSAAPNNLGILARLQLSNDKMLPTVRNHFIAAYKQAGKDIPEGAFVRVWNLFYLCCADLRDAVRRYRRVHTPLFCQSENCCPPLVWFVWGGSDPALDSLKLRFASLPAAYPCFYDWVDRVMKPGIPCPSDFAKHPQGLAGSEVVPFLADRI